MYQFFDQQIQRSQYEREEESSYLRNNLSEVVRELNMKKEIRQPLKQTSCVGRFRRIKKSTSVALGTQGDGPEETSQSLRNSFTPVCFVVDPSSHLSNFFWQISPNSRNSGNRPGIFPSRIQE